ncbi:MAG: fructosamine kinase family protein [Polyangiaceae bacterium]|nr:fructosamine kinase family protein [Polyangiaceae bacterium]MCB9605863.1 fructosamine kinase family protein [Polyangiaceae bacterium]
MSFGGGELSAALGQAIAEALGARVTQSGYLSGGDINIALRCTLDDGRLVFLKTNNSAPKGMFHAEALGLEWLREAQTLQIPEVLAVSTPSDPEQFLVLELLESGRRRADFDEVLGRGLAALHRSLPAEVRFGLDHDNYIGRLPQGNNPGEAAATDWATFYVEQRLEPQLKLAQNSGLASSKLRHGFSKLLPKVADLVGDAEPASRLHGDLWGGNLHTSPSGEPVLIDPAAYAGHREMDLAMMRLFGGFGEGVFAAYEEAHPLSAGSRERLPLYQLYPLMVHVNLFGGSYVSSVEQQLKRLL